MASNQTNRFQSLADSSKEEFIDGLESEHAKKKTELNIALFHEFLALKGRRDEKLNKEYERGIRA